MGYSTRGVPIVVVLLVFAIGSCASPPPERPVPQPSTPEPPTRPSSPPEEKPAEQDVPEEADTGEEPSDVEPDHQTAPVWTPPHEAAPPRPADGEQTEMREWLRTRPTRVVMRRPPVEGALSFAFRRYLNEIVSAAGIRSNGPVAETAFLIDIAPELSRAESALNRYGTAVLNVRVTLEGADAPAVATSITGPSTLSRLSSEDAQLNSLREISGQTLQYAVATLREELSEEIASRGVPYRITRSGGSRDELHAVLRSLGIPTRETGDFDSGDFPEVWLLFGSPGTISRRLGDILDGSGYEHGMHPLHRTITITYNEEN